MYLPSNLTLAECISLFDSAQDGETRVAIAERLIQELEEQNIPQWTDLSDVQEKFDELENTIEEQEKEISDFDTRVMNLENEIDDLKLENERLKKRLKKQLS